jgi:hypothetical protein
MILDKYINIIKDFLLKCIIKIDKSKTYIYILFFILYFLIYYSLTLPVSARDSKNNQLFELSEKIEKKAWILILIDCIAVLAFIGVTVYYFMNFKNITQKINMIIIFTTIFISTLLIYFNILTYSKKLDFIANSKITKYVFLVLSYIFYTLLIILFIYNINKPINIEFFISIEILLLFLLENIVSSLSSINKIYYELKNNDFSILTVNCFNNQNIENYSDTLNNGINQITSISEKYGDNYLKTVGNIPVSYLNKKQNYYQDLVLADFYYPCSYYTYLANSPLNGTPDLEAIKIALSKFKVRFIHLDIFSNSSDDYDPKALPVVRCKNMREGKTALNLDDIFSIVNKWAWITDNTNNSSYPLFLYLNFNFEQSNENLFIRIYEILLKFFSKYLVDKKYGFSGRNGTFPISLAKMKECIGKIIIITNIYPTRTVLDEIINGSSNGLDSSFVINEYKDSYVKYDKVGIGQDNDKTALVNNTKINLNFYYTEPNEKYKNNNQDKAGLFNPSFQDCAQYGIQGTLMYIFIPDDNLNKWNLFFKNKNNLNPVLKDEVLRLVNNKDTEIKKQNPVVGLQKPQKYCVVPGLISTEKSNLSENPTNVTC